MNRALRGKVDSVGLADFAAGMNNSIQQQLTKRLQAEAVARQIAQQQVDNQMREKTFASGEELKRAQLASLDESRQGLAADRAFQQGSDLNEAMPGGTHLDEANPAVSTLRGAGFGGFLRTKGIDAMAPPAMLAVHGDDQQPDELAGTLPNSPMPSGPRLLTKLPSAAQQNIAADNARADVVAARQAEAEARQAAAQVEAARHNRVMEGRPTAYTQGASGLPPRVQTRVDAIARGFDTQAVVKTTQKMAEAVSFAQSLDPNTTNPADDQAMIYAFAKAMDPDSVVREGEYATVQKYAQSWAQSYGFNVARVFSNTQFLTPQARQNMKATIQKKYEAGKIQYDNVRKSYASKINKTTGQDDGEDWLIDYGGAFPTEAAPSPPGAPAGGDHPPLQKFGVTYTWDGSKYARTP